MNLDDDALRTFNETEKRSLTGNLLALTQSLGAIDFGRTDYDLDLITAWHHQLFANVRDHAGRCRSRDYGEERLTFGPNRSVRNVDVADELRVHFASALRLINDLDARSRDLDFVTQIIRVVSFIHADLIRIHPFRDGNGRISRIAMRFFLLRYGLPPLPLVVPRQEYLLSLNHYFANGDIELLVGLFFRIYANTLR